MLAAHSSCSNFCSFSSFLFLLHCNALFHLICLFILHFLLPRGSMFEFGISPPHNPIVVPPCSTFAIEVHSVQDSISTCPRFLLIQFSIYNSKFQIYDRILKSEILKSVICLIIKLSLPPHRIANSIQPLAKLAFQIMLK